MNIDIRNPDSIKQHAIDLARQQRDEILMTTTKRQPLDDDALLRENIALDFARYIWRAFPSGHALILSIDYAHGGEPCISGAEWLTPDDDRLPVYYLDAWLTAAREAMERDEEFNKAILQRCALHRAARVVCGAVDRVEERGAA